MSKNIKIRLSREAAVGIFTLELSSMKGSYCRASFAQHPAHLSLAFWQNPTAHSGQGHWTTGKQNANGLNHSKKRLRPWLRQHWSGKFESKQPSIKFVFFWGHRSWHIHSSLFAQRNYWFIYFYLHAFFMLEVLFTISPELIHTWDRLTRGLGISRTCSERIFWGGQGRITDTTLHSEKWDHSSPSFIFTLKY